MVSIAENMSEREKNEYCTYICEGVHEEILVVWRDSDRDDIKAQAFIKIIKTKKKITKKLKSKIMRN